MHIMGTRYYKGICMCRPSRAPPWAGYPLCPLLWGVEIVTASRCFVLLLFLLAMCALGFRSPFTFGGETANPPGSLTTELVHRRHSCLRAVIKATHPLLPWKLNPFCRMLSLAGLIPPGLVYFYHFRVDSGHKKPTCPCTLLSTRISSVMRCGLWSHRYRAISFSFLLCLVFSL